MNTAISGALKIRGETRIGKRGDAYGLERYSAGVDVSPVVSGRDFAAHLLEYIEGAPR